jgi:hypothetical protein
MKAIRETLLPLLNGLWLIIAAIEGIHCHSSMMYKECTYCKPLKLSKNITRKGNYGLGHFGQILGQN